MRANRVVPTALILLAAPALTGSAAAAAEPIYYSYSDHGCTLSLSNVYQVTLGEDGRKRTWFKVKVRCTSDSTVRYEAQRWERDNGSPGDEDSVNDKTGDSYGPTSWIDAVGTTKSRTIYWPTSSSHDSPGDHRAEFYLRARFQVDPKAKGLDPYAWSSWKTGPVSPVHV